MRKTAGVTASVLAGLGMVAWVAAEQATSQPAKEPVVWPAAAIKWSDNPAFQGAKMAVLWGDPKKGAYGALKKIPAGTTTGMHTHTQDQRVIVLAGTVVLSIEGGAAKELGAGSYAFVPGGVKHTGDCKAGADCTYFEEQPGASDIKLVEPAAPKQ